MDKRNNTGTLIWGSLLVILGLVFLAQNLNILGPVRDFVWIMLFSLGGAAFLFAYLTEPDGRWWAVIPSLALLGLSGLLLMSALGGVFASTVGPALFLLSLSLAFWVIFFTRRTFWWAIIPGGVLASVSSVVFFEGINVPFDTGGLMLLGLAVTFLLVSFTENHSRRNMWALIPAGVLAVIGLSILLASMSILGYVWPLALVAVGAYFVLRSRGGATER